MRLIIICYFLKSGLIAFSKKHKIRKTGEYRRQKYFYLFNCFHNPCCAGVAQLYFISPVKGATVINPVLARFGTEIMGTLPAGGQVENTGHHHCRIIC